MPSVKKKETFWADEPILEKLATIPSREKSYVIRTALRQYFGIAPKQTQDINQLRDIFQILQEVSHG